jgi:hypothetical protein
MSVVSPSLVKIGGTNSQYKRNLADYLESMRYFHLLATSFASGATFVPLTTVFKAVAAIWTACLHLSYAGAWACTSKNHYVSMRLERSEGKGSNHQMYTGSVISSGPRVFRTSSLTAANRSADESLLKTIVDTFMQRELWPPEESEECA